MEHHADRAGGAVWAEGVVLPDEEIRVCGRWGTTPAPPAELFGLGAWCFRTKEQGFAGGEAPRRSRRWRVLTQGRGASGRRNKGLRGMGHHAGFAGAPQPAGLISVAEPMLSTLYFT